MRTFAQNEQIHGKTRAAVADLGTRLGLDGTYIARSYIEQVMVMKGSLSASEDVKRFTGDLLSKLGGAGDAGHSGGWAEGARGGGGSLEQVDRGGGCPSTPSEASGNDNEAATSSGHDRCWDDPAARGASGTAPLSSDEQQPSSQQLLPRSGSGRRYTHPLLPGGDHLSVGASAEGSAGEARSVQAAEVLQQMAQRLADVEGRLTAAQQGRAGDRGLARQAADLVGRVLANQRLLAQRQREQQAYGVALMLAATAAGVVAAVAFRAWPGGGK